MRTILPLLLALPTTAFAAPEPAERPVEVALRLEEPGGATRALALLVGSSLSTLDLREGDTKLFVRVGKADRPDGAVILEIELSRQTTSKGGERAFRVMTRHEVALGVPFEVARLADPDGKALVVAGTARPMPARPN